MERLRKVVALLICMALAVSITGCRGGADEKAMVYTQTTPNYCKHVFNVTSGDVLPGKKNQITFECNYAAGGSVSVTLDDVWVQAAGVAGRFKITNASRCSVMLKRDIKVGDSFNVGCCKYSGEATGYGSMLLVITKMPTNSGAGELEVTYDFTTPKLD